jgi:endonuclease YncB( thermonuclease family)
MPVKIGVFVIGSLAALLVGAVVVAGLIGGGDNTGSSLESEPAGTPDGYAQVTRVIDGETVVLSGLGTTRLIGAETRFTRDHLEGKRVGYEFDKDRRDLSGRNLLYLYRNGMHNLALVENGFADPRTSWPNVRYATGFIEANRRAEATHKGRFSGECERRRRAAALERLERRAAREHAHEHAEARRERRRRAARRRARLERQAEEYLRSYEDERDSNVGG